MINYAGAIRFQNFLLLFEAVPFDLSSCDDLLKRGVKVNILNMGMVDNTPTGKLILTVMLGFAEFERDMIIQRTQEGKAIAKAKC